MAEGNNVLTVTLKQRSPYVTHKGYGPVLRESELKPALRRFLEILLTKKCLWPKDWDKELLGKNIEATRNVWGRLHCRVENNEAEEDNTLLSLSININGETKYFQYYPDVICQKDTTAKRLIAKENIKVAFRIRNCQDVDLAWLEPIFPIFFAGTTFGRRGSKGFGGFYPNNCSDFENSLTIYAQLYNMDLYKREACGIMDTRIKIILDDWRTIRMGVRDNRGVYKNISILRHYFFYKYNKSTEKRFVKRNFSGMVLGRKPHSQYCDTDSKPTINEGQAYARALLGYAPSMPWGNKTVTSTHDQKDIHGKKVMQQKIERFRSPVQFHLGVENGIYVLVGESTPLLGKTFRFSVSGQDINKNLDTPSDFNLKEFFEYCLGNSIESQSDNPNGSQPPPFLRTQPREGASVQTYVKIFPPKKS